MTRTPNYKLATNTAYDILNQYSGDYPNVDIFNIISSLNHVETYTYSDFAFLNGLSYEQALEIFPSSHGFTLTDKSTGKSIIIFNERKPIETVKFTLAHELGHILLGHINDDIIDQKEADCFARNIICPIPIVRYYKLSLVEDYAACFHISEPMAEVALKFKETDYFYISNSNYITISNKFFLNLSGYSESDIYGYA